MKRIRDVEKYQRHQRSRLRNHLARVRRDRGGPPRGRATRGKARVALATVVAPETLSIFSNPEESIAFFDHLSSRHSSRQAVFVALSGVKVIHSCAIVVLLAVMVRFKEDGIRFSVSQPKLKEARDALRSTGFIRSLYSAASKKQDQYAIGRDGSLHTHASKRVDAALGSEIIGQASSVVWGSPARCQNLQRVLLELMQNTNNHAEPEIQGSQHWWLSVTYKKSDHIASFTFVDLGVGIFRSLDAKPQGSKWHGWRAVFQQIFGLTDDAELLRLILAGELHRTVTQLPFRGKGLPGIREAADRGGISNLRILSNDVSADIKSDKFTTLGRPFRGTLVSWDLGKANLHAED